MKVKTIAHGILVVLLTLATLGSLLLRTFYLRKVFIRPDPYRVVRFYQNWGTIELVTERRVSSCPDSPYHVDFAGFRYSHGHGSHVISCVRIALIPKWTAPTAFGVYPVIAFIRGPLRRTRRRRKGLCITCGYNLTGNESGVCPECGSECSKDEP